MKSTSHKCSEIKHVSPLLPVKVTFYSRIEFFVVIWYHQRIAPCLSETETIFFFFFFMSKASDWRIFFEVDPFLSSSQSILRLSEEEEHKRKKRPQRKQLSHLTSSYRQKCPTRKFGLIALGSKDGRRRREEDEVLEACEWNRWSIIQKSAWKKKNVAASTYLIHNNTKKKDETKAGMFKCAPYIKSFCSSLAGGTNPPWLKESSSLPASPVRQAWQQHHHHQQQQQQQPEDSVSDCGVVIHDEDEILRVSAVSLPTLLPTVVKGVEDGVAVEIVRETSSPDVEPQGAVPKITPNLINEIDIG